MKKNSNTFNNLPKKMRFFGKTGTLCDHAENLGNNLLQCMYVIKFKTCSEIWDFYEKIKPHCHFTNYSLRPSEKFAYGDFKKENFEYQIYSPKQSNGDSNWFDYPEDSPRYALIAFAINKS